MFNVPFEIISCAWPRPVVQTDGRWTSEPEWDTPVMPFRPEPHWMTVHGEWTWMIDWRRMFRSTLRVWDPNISGEMREFHVVFRLRIHGSGNLIFWDDDGSIIRQNGRTVHEDRSAHMLTRSEMTVEAGDILEVALWQLYGDWLWGAWLQPQETTRIEAGDQLRGYLGAVEARLRHPNGPPLKLFTNGVSAVRTVVSLYSMILNGYAPSQIILFGENQWSKQARHLFTYTLPFADVVSAGETLARIRSVGGGRIVDLASRWWFVMKTCVALLCPPGEFCLMDDDIYILECVTDALQAFEEADLVFAPDFDHGLHYQRAWQRYPLHPELPIWWFR